VKEGARLKGLSKTAAAAAEARLTKRTQGRKSESGGRGTFLSHYAADPKVFGLQKWMQTAFEIAKI
jgi:hypothetical protein